MTTPDSPHPFMADPDNPAVCGVCSAPARTLVHLVVPDVTAVPPPDVPDGYVFRWNPPLGADAIADDHHLFVPDPADPYTCAVCKAASTPADLVGAVDGHEYKRSNKVAACMVCGAPPSRHVRSTADSGESADRSPAGDPGIARTVVPTPVVTAQVCSVCGLSWDDHGDEPTVETCVGLLKSALEAARRAPWITVERTTPTTPITPIAPYTVNPYRIGDPLIPPAPTVTWPTEPAPGLNVPPHPQVTRFGGPR